MHAAINYLLIAKVYLQWVLRPSRNQKAGVMVVLLIELSRVGAGAKTPVNRPPDESKCVGIASRLSTNTTNNNFAWGRISSNTDMQYPVAKARQRMCAIQLVRGHDVVVRDVKWGFGFSSSVPSVTFGANM